MAAPPFAGPLSQSKGTSEALQSYPQLEIPPHEAVLLGGTAHALPRHPTVFRGRCLVFGPHDDAEIAVVSQLLQAAEGFARGKVG
jgi:hypothetical protein